jgi:hypothetical protein
MMRASDALTIWPKPAPVVTPGRLKFVWLSALKNSARNCMPKRSVKAKFLARLKSKFTSPGARTIPTPELPKIWFEVFAVSGTNAPVSNQRSTVR